MSEQDYYQWQHDYWAGLAADWETWAEIVAPQAAGFNRPLIEAAGIAGGSRVLDLAAGAGEPALTAAETAGPDGHVTASDYSGEMLAVAERRAKAKGLENMSFQRADMKALPFDDDHFDCVISRFGVMYTEDPAATFAEIARVLKPGGRAALMVWGPGEANTVLTVALAAANEKLGLLDDEKAAHPFIYAAKNSLTTLFNAAGFRDPAEQDLTFQPQVPGNMPFWQPIIGMNMGSAMRDMDKDALARLDAHIAEAHAPYLKDGKYHLSAHIRIGTATAA